MRLQHLSLPVDRTNPHTLTALTGDATGGNRLDRTPGEAAQENAPSLFWVTLIRTFQ